MTKAAKTEFDTIVLGSGAGGMAAALFAALEGHRVCLIEKSSKFGGTTAWSDGMVWAPLTRIAAEAGHTDDSEAEVLEYLGALVPGAAEDPGLRAFLAAAPAALDRLADETQVKMQPVPVYPDYHSDLPGAKTAGRVLEPVPFDAATLGPALARLRPPLPEFALMNTMMLARPDIPHFRKVGQSFVSTLVVVRQMARFFYQRLRYGRGTTLVLGNALVARFLRSLMDAGVELRRNTEVAALDRNNSGTVCGVTLKGGQGLAARRGVVLATGGFMHDPKRRRAFLDPALGDHSATFPGNTGDGADLAESVGAVVGSGTEGGAFFAPVSRYTRPDGSRATYPHTVVDRAKPGLIAVDSGGRRFVNEAVSYHEFTKGMLKCNRGPDSKAWLIVDSRFLWNYGLGAIKPMTVNKRPFLAQGYLHRAPTPKELARQIGIPEAHLSETVARYNENASRGEDPDFGKGSTAYQRFLGDAEVGANPCLAPVARPPFYAVEVRPGDLGAAAGIETDANARALDADGTPVPGLYACGADARSVMQGAYPGPGITLGPAITFGFLAVQHMSKGN